MDGAQQTHSFNTGNCCLCPVGYVSLSLYNQLCVRVPCSQRQVTFALYKCSNFKPNHVFFLNQTIVVSLPNPKKVFLFHSQYQACMFTETEK